MRNVSVARKTEYGMEIYRSERSQWQALIENGETVETVETVEDIQSLKIHRSSWARTFIAKKSDMYHRTGDGCNSSYVCVFLLDSLRITEQANPDQHMEHIKLDWWPYHTVRSVSIWLYSQGGNAVCASLHPGTSDCLPWGNAFGINNNIHTVFMCLEIEKLVFISTSL